MPTYRMCRFCDSLHDVHDWPDNHREWVPDNRSELAAPMIIRDSMDAVQGMHDGRMYESKRALRQSYRDHGVVEVGNDPSVMAPKPRKQIRTDRKVIREHVNKAVSQTNLSRYKRDELPTR